MAKRRKKRTAAKRAPKKSSFLSRFHRKGEGREVLPKEVRPWVFGIFLFVLAIFAIFSFFNLSGIAGRGFVKIFRFLMGETIFVVPLIFALGGFSCFFSKQRSKWSIFLAVALLIIGIAGILGLFDLSSNNQSMEFRLFYAGRGGWLGNISSWPLMKIFGFWVSLIILLALIVIAGIIFKFFIYSPRKKDEISEDEEEEFTPGKVDKEIKKPLIHKVFAPKFQVSKIEDQEKNRRG
jgi:hypothetical protein